ncbi:hypothetical protein O7626_01985 [Micromonospora sp. WMMD1102]|uniref:hypothetical protein n=1 Tax=Micromonospora sp. WMMD1102 TaxID=3016105 RepID=UPI0024154317|nr:hypothetical protein [Micromonospora sp. WMMD1102]MDG4784711.1 hypothetical protein [Micromonospora sp. WMMD1102]
MVDQHPDPSGNTEAFRAFAQSPEAAAAEPPSRLPLIIGIALAVVVVVALVGWLALG